MSRPDFKAVIDCDRPEQRERAKRRLDTLRGQYRVTFEPTRLTRSQRANAFYWSCVVTPFYDFLREQDWEIRDKDEAHEILKAAVLPEPPPLVNRSTGQVATFRRSRETHRMSVEDFTDYVERARHWLMEKVGVPTDDPDPVAVGGRR